MKDFIMGCLCRDEKKRFDWEQIFLHPLFGGKFSKNFSGKQEGAT
jgi:serine/threonine protein kinase